MKTCLKCSKIIRNTKTKCYDCWMTDNRANSLKRSRERVLSKTDTELMVEELKQRGLGVFNLDLPFEYAAKKL